MNSLSWLLYWAAVCDNIGGSMGLICILLGLALIPCTAFYIIVNFCSASDPPDKDCLGARPFMNRLWRLNMALFFGTMALFAVIPDKKTVYAMAASEVGEQVVKSESVQGVAGDAAKALQGWIKQQMEPPPKSEKKS